MKNLTSQIVISRCRDAENSKIGSQFDDRPSIFLFLYNFTS
jgi:hypothetical protein